MNKGYIKKIIFSITVVLSFVLASCSNLLNSNKSESVSVNNVYIRGSIDQNSLSSILDDFYFENSRTVFPSSIASVIYYTIKAEKSGSETVAVQCDSTNPVFELKITSTGNWTVWAEGFSDSARTVSIVKTQNSAVTINDEGDAPLVNLVAKPYIDSEKNGSLKLEFNFAGITYQIPGFVATCISSNSADWNAATLGGSYSQSVLHFSSIKSGVYTVQFTFMGKKSGESGNYLLYSCTQVINVYANLESDNLVSNGNESYISSGKITLTDTLIENFLESTFYVDSAVTSATQTGSWFHPYKKISTAIDEIQKRSSAGPFYIYVKDGSSETFTKSYTFGAQEILIDAYKNSPGDKLGKAIIKYVWETTEDVFVTTNSTDSKITFSGINFDGKNESDSVINRSQTVFAVTSGVLTFLNCSLQKFTLENKHFIDIGAGTLFFNNSEIKNLSFTITDTNEYYAINVPPAGKFSVSGKCIISENFSSNDGKARNVYLGKTAGVTGFGKISLSGQLLADSSIHFTHSNESVINATTTQTFTDKYSDYNTTAPNKYFVSDSNYVISFNTAKQEGVMAVSSGNVNLYMGEPVSIELVSPIITSQGICFKLYKGTEVLNDINFEYSLSLLLKNSSKKTITSATATASDDGVFVLQQGAGFSLLDYNDGIYSLYLQINKIGGVSLGYTAVFDVYVANEGYIPLTYYKEKNDNNPEAGSKIGIYSLQDLQLLSSIVSNTWNNKAGEEVAKTTCQDVEIKLFEDINLNGSSANPWVPIAVYKNTADNVFNGTFDGNNHIIKGLYTTSGSEEAVDYGIYTGLFGHIGSSGAVKKLTVYGQFSDGSIAGYNEGKITECTNYATINSVNTTDNCGGIACVSSGTIVSCVNKADLSADTKDNVAAIVAVLKGTSSIVEKCKNYGEITANNKASGIAGVSTASGVIFSISDCVNYGSIITKTSYSSGILGYSTANELSTISTCYNYGKIISEKDNYHDGLCAGISSYCSNLTVTGCKNYGNLSGWDFIGGILGFTNGSITVNKCENFGEVYSRGYSSGAGKDARAGGIVGKGEDCSSITIINTINRGNVTSAFCVGGILGRGKTGGTTIINCLNTGIIKLTSGNGASAGISGFSATVKNCVNTGSVYNTANYDNNNEHQIAGISAGTSYTYDNNFYTQDIICSYGTNNVFCYGAGVSGPDTIGQTTPIYIDYNSSEYKTCYITENALTVNGTTSKNPVTLLNAWIDKQATPSVYVKWNEDMLTAKTSGVPIASMTALENVISELTAGDYAVVDVSEDFNLTPDETSGDITNFLTVPAGATLVLEANSTKVLSFMANPGNNGYANTGIEISGELILRNIKITSSNTEFGNGGCITITSTGKLTIGEGTEIVSCNSSGRAYSSVITVEGNGELVMNGGSISNNTAHYYGGAVRVENNGSFIMNGGEIKNNTNTSGGSDEEYAGNGGGVYVTSGGMFVMNGGTISGNTTSGGTGFTKGGGVYVASNGSFVFAGGTISGNTAENGNKYFVKSGGKFGTSEAGLAVQASDLAVND